MAKEIKKPGKVEEPDLLPAMGLFTILIPMLLSMTAFSKLAIVEVNLPERSMMQMDDQTPPPPDEQALNLSLAITDEYLVIGARGGFQPNVYFKEFWVFRCKSDGQLIKYAADDVKKAISAGSAPKCKDGSEMDAEKYLYEIETIELDMIEKTSEEDAGRLMWGVYTSQSEGQPDSVLVDGNNNFLALVGEGDGGVTPPSALKKPGAGVGVATLAQNSARKLKPEDAAKLIVYPLSAYDEISKQLIQIHTAFIDLEDVDNIIIVANDNVQFDKIIQLMDRAKSAGFVKVNLAKLGG
ncbi:MAG: biopolymer transporter ExbD [Fibrobacter sp.]|nr:biopolymer transporter ExbD [Fibrobacter sp.]MDY6370280.1 biopolymer transporter ExbD [Fibrobacter sp.]MDY6390575.1 biopolymer transporter ExbD [Fibrobacter sp.]